MVRCSTAFFLLCTFLYGETSSEKFATSSEASKEPPVIREDSGLSNEQILQKAEKFAQPSGFNAVEDADKNATMLSKEPPKRWEDLSPTPSEGFDWIRTKHGDWLKGHIRYIYDDDVEFDSPEFGLITISLGDIKQMKSYEMMRVNIDNEAIFVGLIDYKDSEITIHSGNSSYTFERHSIISVSTAKTKERYLWSGDITLDYDLRRGNTDQSNATLKISLKRRTPKDRFAFDYLGRYSKSHGEKTAEDSRVSTKYDYFLSKRFFITPLFGEYYRNYFQNIRHQTTLGSGVGYTLIDTPKSEWYVSAGPAWLYTEFYKSDTSKESVESSPSFEILTKYEFKLYRLHKLKIEYKMTFSDKKSGKFRHHFLSKLENDIIKDKIFLDMSFLWDYVKEVQSTKDLEPLRNDYQFLVGAGVKF